MGGADQHWLSGTQQQTGRVALGERGEGTLAGDLTVAHAPGKGVKDEANDARHDPEDRLLDAVPQGLGGVRRPHDVARHGGRVAAGVVTVGRRPDEHRPRGLAHGPDDLPGRCEDHKAPLLQGSQEADLAARNG